MGYLQNLTKSTLSEVTSQIKSVNIQDKISSAVNAINPDFGSIGIKKPAFLDNIKFSDVKIDSLKGATGDITNYVSPVAKKFLDNVTVGLPAEINGIALPEMPDLSAMAGDVDAALKNIGVDTKQLGMPDVDSILKGPSLPELAKVEMESPVDLNNMPDLASSMDDISFDSIQDQINEMTSQIPGAEHIDISEYLKTP